jgi:hypothetical protein
VDGLCMAMLFLVYYSGSSSVKEMSRLAMVVMELILGNRIG